MRGNVTVYGVYEKNEEEECRFIGTLEEIVKEFNTSASFVRKCVSTNQDFLRNYKIVSLYRIVDEKGIK